MILKINHLKVKAAAKTQGVIEAIYDLLKDGLITQDQFAHLQIELDWIQYKHNFREPVLATQSYELRGQTRVMDIHIDTRQVSLNQLRDQLLRAIRRAEPGAPQESGRLRLEDFGSLRNSIVWEFNKFYWKNLLAWEAATGKGYDQALPGGASDGHNPEAIEADACEFHKLLEDMDRQKMLPEKIHLLEIGVGSGARCGLWMDAFQKKDAAAGTNYYPRVCFNLGDYSLDTLEKARPNIARHWAQCDFQELNALNPIRDLGHLRHKVLQVHLTNVYDNLPDEEVARRDGRVYFVQVRAYLPSEEVERLSMKYGVPVNQFRDRVYRMLECGFEDFGGPERGVPFWQELWEAIRLEERMVQLEDLVEYPFPDGLDYRKLEDILETAPSDFRFHLSSGALESFVHTLPLLHPRGYLQVYDIFVTELAQYRTGYFGPGKLDGSLLSWVNGALLKEVAERSGYDVHFRPFTLRENSKTTVLYTTRRE